MSGNKRSSITSSGQELLYKMFMEMPLPMTISIAENGTYIDVNEATAKYMGLKRKDIIGRKSLDFTHFTKEQRRWLTNTIKKQGFANNFPVKLKIGNREVLHMLCSIFPFKIGKNNYFWGIGTNISNTPSDIDKYRDEKFFKIIVQYNNFVEEKLKQYKLTPRQREITLLSSLGYSDEEIAKKLHISEHTIKDHMKEIRKIMCIRRRSQLFPKLLNIC